MKKAILICACIMFSFVSPSHQARAQKQDVADFVYSFYRWYGATLLAEPRQSPLKHSDVYKYVSPCTVQIVRINYDRGLLDHDYFFKGQDFYEEFFAGLKVYDYTKVNNDLYLATVGFVLHGKEDAPYLLVFIENKNGKLRVIKVEDAQYGY